MRSIQRYNLGERLVHAVAGVSYVYLLLTGLAFWTPALYWMAVVLGGGYLSRLLHPWVGLMFAVAVVWMFVIWRDAMRTTDEDRAWRRAIRSYIRNDDARVPGAGRFNYGQKMLFWLMTGGGAVLLVSGAVMWWVASVPWELRGLREVATLVHALAALATIGGFIIHVYMGVAVVPDSLSAVIHGRVSEDWARRHHPLWLAALPASPVGRRTSGAEGAAPVRTSARVDPPA
jgi:formate dehydrogenase subunit gamma